MENKVIYKIINTVNGKFYVGSTTNSVERFRTHRTRLRKNRHHAIHLQAAWNKYGEQAFVFHVVETVAPDASLQEAENKWLAEHVGKDYCYNKSRYSDAPMRGVPKEQHPSFGRPVSDEQRKQISTTLKEFYAKDITNHPRFGTHHTEESKAKISASKKANPSRPWLGKERDEETRRKIGDAQRGKAKGSRTYTPEGLARAQENMRRNAREQAPKGFAEVFAKFPEEIRVKYDFSGAVYTGALNRITGCKCPTHGEFSQYAAQFRKGRGCPQCGAEQRAESKRAEMKRTWASEEGREMFLASRTKSVDAPSPDSV